VEHLEPVHGIRERHRHASFSLEPPVHMIMGPADELDQAWTYWPGNGGRITDHGTMVPIYYGAECIVESQVRRDHDYLSLLIPLHA
jgi:hypothetical protein